MKKIFISRKLSSDSSFFKLDNCHIVDQSLLEFHPVDFELPECEWLFFYSQNGVNFFLEKQNIPSDLKIGTIGKKTAKILSNAGYNVDFIGSGDPESTAQNYKAVKGKTCYIRAKNSANSIKNLIAHPQDIDLIVYNNQCSEQIPKDDFGILIFTSTRNAQAFFNRRIYQNETVIAIGKPTQSFLSSIGIPSIIPQEPTMESVFDLVEI